MVYVFEKVLKYNQGIYEELQSDASKENQRPAFSS